MEVHHVLHDGQPQAGAHLGPLVVLVHLVVPLPDVPELLRGDALSRVGDGHPHHAVVHRLAQGHGLVRAGVGDGVVHQVVHHLGDAQLVGGDEHVPVGVEGEGVVRQLLVPGQGLADGLRQVEAALLQGDCPGLQPGQVQQVVDQACEPLRLVDDDLHVLRGVLSRQVPHDLTVALDHSQGRAQVVGDVCQQLPAHLVHFGELPRRVVQGLGKLGDLPGAALLQGDGVVALAQLLGRLVDGRDGPGDPPGDEQGQQQPQHHHHPGQAEELDFQRLHRGAHRGDLALHQHHPGLSAGVPLDPAVEHHLGRGIPLAQGEGLLQPAPLEVHVVVELGEHHLGGHAPLGQGRPQGALLLRGEGPGQQPAVLVADQNGDLGVVAQVLHRLAQLFLGLVQLAEHRLGGVLHLVCLDELVEGPQQGDLEHPQQDHRHQGEAPKAQEDLQVDSQGAAGGTLPLGMKDRGRHHSTSNR